MTIDTIHGFGIILDRNASSPNPQQSIWTKQHICVSEDSRKSTIPDESRCGEIVIKHQLNSKCPHVSVLDQAFVSFNCFGFPHSTMTQIRTHTASGLKVLAQSGRYTGNRFVQVAEGLIDIERVIFFSPVGIYQDRQGNRYHYTEAQRELDKASALNACEIFAAKVRNGCPYELAREQFPYEFRQDFGIAGTFRSLFHMIDYRSKADSEKWCQIFSKLIMEEMKDNGYALELVAWYMDKRFGKAITGV